MSPGTKLTSRLADKHKATIYREGSFRVAEKSDFVKRPDFLSQDDHSLAYYSPLPEVAFFPRTHHTSNAGSYLLLPESEARFLAELPSKPEADISRIVQKFSKRNLPGPGKAERLQHQFEVTVETLDENSNRSRVAVQGNDPYGLTALLAVRTLNYLLQQKKSAYGVKSPGSIMSGNHLLENLESENKISISRYSND
jgi:short subunit dehydrogenase-like uncharacterized protein